MQEVAKHERTVRVVRRMCTFKSESVFSAVKTNIYFIIFDTVVKNKSNVV